MLHTYYSNPEDASSIISILVSGCVYHLSVSYGEAIARYSSRDDGGRACVISSHGVIPSDPSQYTLTTVPGLIRWTDSEHWRLIIWRGKQTQGSIVRIYRAFEKSIKLFIGLLVTHYYFFNSTVIYLL